MDEDFHRVLAVYNERLRLEREILDRDPRASSRRPDKFLLAVGEETARFLHEQAIARNAVRILEIGTSGGYSTLFLADAARRTGGRVITIDLSAEKQKVARAALTAAGLVGFVDFRTGNALDLLPAVEGPIDFVLLDIWKNRYVACLNRFYHKLAGDALVVADNMLKPEFTRPHAEHYMRQVERIPGSDSTLMPIGQGIYVSRIRGPALPQGIGRHAR